MSSRFKYFEYPKEIRKNLIERDKKRKKESNNKDADRKKRKKWPIVLLVIFLIILIAVAVVIFFYFHAKNNIHTNENFELKADIIGLDDGNAPVIHDSGKTIEYNGHTYSYNDNIVSFALLGVDKESLGSDYGIIGTAGQADTIAVVLYDTSTAEANVLVIPRDTMVDVNTYDTNGKYLDIKKLQICVSYAYGDGKESSCDNTIKSINRLLLGIPVDYYVALDLDGIPALNDAIGGVTLTCIETEGQFKKGETVTLKGQDADDYVRDRDMSVLDSDSARRARQKQYMECYLDQLLSMIKNDFSVVGKFYNQAAKYSFTDITLSKLTYLASTAVTNDFKIVDYKTVPGEYQQGERYAEYVVDQDELFEMILSLWYTEVD